MIQALALVSLVMDLEIQHRKIMFEMQVICPNMVLSVMPMETKHGPFTQLTYCGNVTYDTDFIGLLTIQYGKICLFMQISTGLFLL